MSILSLLDGLEPENDTIYPRSHFLYLGRRGGGEVLKLSSKIHLKSKYGSGQGLRGHALLSPLASCPA